MASSISLPQASFAAATIASCVGSFISVTPPNPSKKDIPQTGDTMRSLKFTNKRTNRTVMGFFGLLGLHTSALALQYPRIQPSLIRHGLENGLNTNLITWSSATTVPLALLLGAGIPLRLLSFSSLGKNFTFDLAEPDHLKTDGIYKYVQHPSYSGLIIVSIGNLALLMRTDGVLSCWISPKYFKPWRIFWSSIFIPVWVSLAFYGMWKRVRQEEDMLKAEFGEEWESWHARTARFIPWIF
ncbi:hypothetical protein M426DRAFT_320674 [Hypoxylon sp. CI-4A]|nr:hypothetical protein M426DRAFT_320674 [Hypoxylon sp. CI-4A]